MSYVAIVGGGPKDLIPDLHQYKDKVSCWIGSDRGVLHIIEQGVTPDVAIGDFDSVSAVEKALIKKNSRIYQEFPAEKDETDLELAVIKAIEQKADKLLLFGVTGGRIDHSMAAIQLLYRLLQQSIKGIIVDKGNWMELVQAGEYELTNESSYPHISFIPFSKEVTQLSLEGFFYPLNNTTVTWGSTLCVSNKLIREKGTFSFNEGILIVIKSRDVLI
ncbi:thiamine diphosphokinase [Radiobacillus sp. PE A8.2]|uniref:thiamine diphosphokinase n=1 Tax=Radiobacillus sp. PE A8.2 TaxID=3380349 RepID=UPI0038908502